MRTGTLCLAVLMIAGCGGAEATSNVVGGENGASDVPASSEVVPPEVADAVMAWSNCRSPKVVDQAQSPLSSEAVVDEALRQCVEFEDATVMLWEKHYGPNSRGQVQELRARWRQELIANLDRMRGLASHPVDPVSAWGICVGQQIPDPVPADITPDTLIGAAMEACSPEMEQVRKDYTRLHGATTAAAMVEQMQEQIRRFATASIEDDHSARSVR